MLAQLSLKKGSKRSINLKINLLASFILKAINIGISLLIVPITLQALDKEKYGLWLTLNSFITWFALFDFGLGNGLRNKFAEAKAKNNLALCQTYVSTTFAIIAIIIGVVFILFMACQPFLHWSSLLNAKPGEENELSILAIIVFSFFCLQFILKQTTVILLADQKSGMVELIGLLGNVLSLLGILAVLHFFSSNSLLSLGIILSACPVIVLAAVYFILFNGRYKVFKPAINKINFKYSKSLLGLGVQFFIAQISSIVIFSTSNLIISQIMGPGQVTPYNIAFKYFNLITLGFQVVLAPFWSAFTEAYTIKDIPWIKNAIKKLVFIWGASCAGSAIMLLLCNTVYSLWVGKNVQVPFALSALYAVYVCVGNWNNIFVSFCLGAGKLRLQVYLSIFGGIINIPLTILFLKLFGLPGDVLAMILSIIAGSVLSPIQYLKIIKGKATGIWRK